MQKATQTQEQLMAQNFTQRTFSENLHDVAQCLILLNNKSLEPSHQTLNRFLLLANVKMLEGIANDIIGSLPINDDLRKDLDKLSTMNKFDLLYFVKTQKKLDYGNHIIGNIRSILIPERNKLIHPKGFSSKFSSTVLDEKTQQIRFQLEKNKIDANGFQLIQESLLFLDIFFIDLCFCDGLYLSRLLCEYVILADGLIGTLQQVSLMEDKNNIETILNTKVKFLSLIVQQQIEIRQK